MTSLLARVIGTAALVLAGSAAMAQEVTNQVAVMTDWSVFTEPKEGKAKECWGVSAPKSSEAFKGGKPASGVSRSDILLWITYRAGGGGKGEVSFTGGYPFKEGSTVSVVIDGSTTISMFTQGETAWTDNADKDAELIAALKKGTTAVFSGVSGRGTETKDTFSLRGFTAAMNDAAKRCN